jgi:hypothetical protein
MFCAIVLILVVGLMIELQQLYTQKAAEVARRQAAIAQSQIENMARREPLLEKEAKEAAEKVAGEYSLISVDYALAKLIQANVAFNVPEHMRVTKTQTIQAKLTVHMTPNELITKLTKPSKPEVQPLLASNRMSATLNGGGAFDISPSGTQTQWISSTQETSWSWEVTPKQSGTQELT